MTMTATTIGADASLFVIEVSPTAALLRATNGGAQHVVWVRWDDFELAASPANDPDLRRLYFRALEAARVMRVVACSEHAATSTRTEAFTHAIAQVAGADAVFAGNNPAAHGGVCQVETCNCGATRRTNFNGPHSEIGAWVYETKDMRDEQGYPTT